MYRGLRPWFWLDFFFFLYPGGWKYKKSFSTIHEFTRKVIKEKKELLLNQQNIELTKRGPPTLNETPSVKKRKAFLEILLDMHINDPSFTEEDIREEVDTFMFEGHDTTAMAISWTLYKIGSNPDVQGNIFEELDVIFNNNRRRPITCEDLKAMKYLDCVIKESLRLYPSVPLIGREVTEDVNILGYRIPARNTAFLILNTILHKDPKIYPNPEKFDPSRFFPENCSGRHPYAYIPFSAGSRNCIGQRFAMMEEKTVIANILRHFKLQSLDQDNEIIVLPELVLRSVTPIRMRLAPR